MGQLRKPLDHIQSQSTRDVLERLLARVTGIEEELRQFRAEVGREFTALRTDFRQDLSAMRVESQQGTAGVRSELQHLGARLDMRLDTTTRWLVGLILLSWLSLMASIWLKP